eukprot:COSAG01_NODE_1415_length_10390_cov_2.905549_4_plen_196_part_00
MHEPRSPHIVSYGADSLRTCTLQAQLQEKKQQLEAKKAARRGHKQPSPTSSGGAMNPLHGGGPDDFHSEILRMQQQQEAAAEAGAPPPPPEALPPAAPSGTLGAVLQSQPELLAARAEGRFSGKVSSASQKRRAQLQQKKSRLEAMKAGRKSKGSTDGVYASTQRVSDHHTRRDVEATTIDTAELVGNDVLSTFF